MKFSISVRKVQRQGVDKYSFDIRQLDEHGIAAPGGTCHAFRWLDDGEIFVKEYTKKDIPGSWPNLNQWDWSKDFTAII